VAENTETPPSDEPFQPIRPWSSFLIRDYRFIWIAILCANTSMHMRNDSPITSRAVLQLAHGVFLPSCLLHLLGGVLRTFQPKMIVSTQLLNLIPGAI
jgi:hypothetical protein